MKQLLAAVLAALALAWAPVAEADDRVFVYNNATVTLHSTPCKAPAIVKVFVEAGYKGPLKGGHVQMRDGSTRALCYAEANGVAYALDDAGASGAIQLDQPPAEPPSPKGLTKTVE